MLVYGVIEVDPNQLEDKLNNLYEDKSNFKLIQVVPITYTGSCSCKIIYTYER